MTSIRSIEQNSKMWAMLQEISEQKTHCGRKYEPYEWKILFMHALGQQTKFMPSLDSSTFVPYGNWPTRRLTIGQMTELIAFMDEWGLHNGVRFATDRGVIWDDQKNSQPSREANPRPFPRAVRNE
jgi:hypothetical protein